MRPLRSAPTLLLALLLVACGQKGALYLPDHPPSGKAPTKQAPVTPAPAEEKPSDDEQAKHDAEPAQPPGR